MVNAADTAEELILSWPAPAARDLLTGRRFSSEAGQLTLPLQPRQGLLLQELSGQAGCFT